MTAGVLARVGLEVLDRLFGWLPFVAAYVAGRRARDAAALEIVAKVKAAQLDIAARPRTSDQRIIERLRRDGSL